jgi:hypothetical protein
VVYERENSPDWVVFVEGKVFNERPLLHSYSPTPTPDWEREAG